MISLLVYGRNDSYGYNLHKRAALSLNNFAEMLSDEDDEILFVDYNTPQGFPTFVEAIFDTLTPPARRKVRVLRVTADLHESLGLKTHLKTVEPIARNVAVRRSNPRNRWILSTNTDMIFVPQKAWDLTQISSSLPDGHYCLPRFEIPEGLWESLERNDPVSSMDSVRDWGKRFHLNQVVHSWEPHMFDGPGDFQLFLRQDLFDIDGFDENMVLGWHVDSNISKRMSFLRGNAVPLTDQIYGYHCDHTRQETAAHKAGASSNSLSQFVGSVSSAELPAQRKTWGLNGMDVVEVDLAFPERSAVVGFLERADLAPQTQLVERRYNAKGYDLDEPGDEIVLVFLLDLLLSFGSDLKILWLGARGRIVEMLNGAAGHSDRIAQIDFSETFPDVSGMEALDKAWSDYDFVVLDFRPAIDNESTSRRRHQVRLQETLGREFRKKSSDPTRYLGIVVGIDVVNSFPENLFSLMVGASKTPYSIGFRYGELKDFRLVALLMMASEKFRLWLKGFLFGIPYRILAAVYRKVRKVVLRR